MPKKVRPSLTVRYIQSKARASHEFQNEWGWGWVTLLVKTGRNPLGSWFCWGYSDNTQIEENI